MRFAMFALFFCMPLAGCASFQTHSQNEAPVSRTVALMPFASPTKSAIGQQAANSVAQKLIEKGYEVIDSSFTTSLVSEAKFYEAGLSDEVRTALLTKKLTTLVFGSINAYSCEPVRSWSFLGTPTDKNRCSFSLAAKMVDTATGKLLWELILNDSAEGRGLTILELLKPSISSNIAATLPLPEPREPAKK